MNRLPTLSMIRPRARASPRVGPRHPRRRSGLVLLEALIASTVLAVGLLALARWQLQLRADTDLAGQRSQAVRIAETELEALRAFASVDAAGAAASFAALTSQTRDEVSTGVGGPARWRIKRRIDTTPVADTKDAAIEVAWRDRAGRSQRVALHAIVLGLDPALAGALALPGIRPEPTAGPRGRAASIPLAATDLGDGSSAFKPAARGTLALVFDNTTGRVLRRCDQVARATATADLDAAALGACQALDGLRLSGTVRFALGAAPDAAHADDAPLAFAIALSFVGSSDPHAPSCGVEPMKAVTYRLAGGAERSAVVAADALPASLGATAWIESGERYASYECAVATRADGRWSGGVKLVPDGWAIGHGAASLRVCRYVADLDASGAIDANREHPAAYVDVGSALTNQNYLVVRGDRACPAPATQPHQP